VGSAVGRLVVEVRADLLCRFAAVRALMRATDLLTELPEQSGTVSVISTATNTVATTITVGNMPFGVAVSPSGPAAGDVFVANQGNGVNGSVSVINPAGTAVTTTISVGNAPVGVAVNPTGTDVFVTNEVSSTVPYQRTAILFQKCISSREYV
jgi:YVTN family beta-propeller protein